MDRGARTRDRWEDRWASALSTLFPGPTDVGELAEAGVKDWSYVYKAGRPAPNGAAAGAGVVAQIGGLSAFARGAMPVYLSLSRDTSEDAGQHALDVLGLNRTFRWTSARDMPRDMFQVRGSKIIQHAYGNHVDELRRMIVAATDPERPRTQGQIRREISDRWSQLTASQVARIARTETAAVWETSNLNAQVANDVRWFEILVAHGPSIGPPTSLPVCPECLEAAAGGPYPLQEVPRVPLHPNCRCATIPSLSHDWLPPAETWSGGPQPPLPLVEAPTP